MHFGNAFNHNRIANSGFDQAHKRAPTFFVNHANTIYYKKQQSILIIKKYNSYIWDSEYYDILNKCFSLLRFETAVVFLEPTNEARRTLLTPDIL